MFCPGCGSQNNTNQSYCRSCGMNLEQTAASLIEQFPGKERLDLKREELRSEKFGNIAFTGFVIVIAIAIILFLYWILANMVFDGTQPLVGILLAAFVVFASLLLGYVFWQESLKEKRQKFETTPADELQSPETGRLLSESSFMPVPDSVVEDTTELLHSKKPNNFTS